MVVLGKTLTLRWFMLLAIAGWASVQATSAITIFLVMSGQGTTIGLDPNRIVVLTALHTWEIAAAYINAAAYWAAVIGLYLRRKWAFYAYGVAVFVDLAVWLSYSADPSYDQIAGGQNVWLDWLVNIALLSGILGFIFLHGRKPQRW